MKMSTESASYWNRECNFSLLMPKSWTVISEEFNNAAWKTLVQLAPGADAHATRVTVGIQTFEDDGGGVEAYVSSLESQLGSCLTNCTFLEKATQTLLGWPSARVVYSFDDSEHGHIKVLDVAALIGSKGIVFFQINCSTTKLREAHDFAAFEKIIESLHAGAPATGRDELCCLCGKALPLEGRRYAYPDLKAGRLIEVCASCLQNREESNNASDEEILFYINGRCVNKKFIVGSPDMGFFQTNAKYLVGECIVRFHVGDQVVENKIVLNRSEFRIDNNFVPFDIELFVAQQKERVGKEKEDAHFVESPTDVFFIPASSLLTCQKTLPAFDRSTLVEDPRGRRFFVSHRWLSGTHPDPEGRHLALLKQHAHTHRGAFYWIDFSSLPQSRNAADEELFRRTLPRIASIQAESSTIVILADDYDERLWCYIEHFAGTLFAQTNLDNIGEWPRTIEYLGDGEIDRSIVDRVQRLEEPAWDTFKITKSSDIPGVKYNYKFLANLVKFQIGDRFSELRNSLPGHKVWPELYYPHSTFGLDYSISLDKLRGLFTKLGGDIDYFYKANSLLWLAERFSWSIYPDDYNIEEFYFSQYLFFSEDMVGWIALLLGIIKVVNRGNDKIVNLRDVYSKIVLMSLFK